MFVLHVVGGGEVHDIGSARAHQLDPGDEHELRELGAVDTRHRQTHELEYPVDTVLIERRLVSLLRGEAHPAQPVTQELAQFVLRRYHRHLAAGVGERGEEGGGAQPLRIVHHDLDTAFGVVEVVAADTVNGG